MSILLEVIILYGGFLLLVVGGLFAVFLLGKKLFSKSQTKKARVVMVLELLVLIVFVFAILFPVQFLSVAQPVLKPTIEGTAYFLHKIGLDK
ncbi:hypothetical protein EPO14_02770 [Patescibacteria group bacterium]|nr:MAG: hypothetical protein EPO14_02770 [Patescibacteria group bacterium]